MVKWLIKKIVGSQNERRVKKLWPVVRQINQHTEALKSLSDEDLQAKTRAWQERLHVYLDPEVFSRSRMERATDEELRELVAPLLNQAEALKEEFPVLGESPLTGAESKEELTQWVLDLQGKFAEVRDEFPARQEEILSEILPEAFAVVKDAARRLVASTYDVCDQPVTWEMVHFDVQLIGGIALHRRNITEMATGEGKTLVATLPVYLNALVGRGVHLITVNDYLARRDSEWMGHVYNFLGLTVGCIQNEQPPHIRREQYGCDITYGTNSEFGFDYLRDNGMATNREEQVQRGHHYAIIDEVDSILIDEARTPLIISGPSTVGTHQYDRFKPLVDQLVRKQTRTCNELIAEAKKAHEAGDLEIAGRLMFKVRLGQPRNRGILRLMEDPELRRASEKAELSFYQDAQKIELFNLKEELYFSIDERAHDADLSEMGRRYLNPDDPEAFVLPDLASAFSEIDGDEEISQKKKDAAKHELQTRMDHQAERIHNISQLLRAYCVYEKDVDYVVEENKVVIVDENTGRKMPGRRWSDGLHQAVEAKEGVKIDRETQTLATITIQNYFRLYEKLGGMTGTAETEAAEFKDIYNLDVLTIPTNRPVQREDYNDRIYKTRREKYHAVIQLLKERHAKRQPILVGTASVESSETLARMLKREKIPHSVLNAKYHRQEAEIVSRAGQPGAITISTNMAGRGTDIKLGEGVVEMGGLLVLATERHESRRIDRQLRGRCARQGDPGESIFYISFEDDLMRNFGAADRMTKIMERFGLEEGQELEHPWLNKSVETAQKRVEQRNYVWRKRVLEFDDVMNQQRTVVYGYRNEVIEAPEPRELVHEAIEEAVPGRMEEFLGIPGTGMEKNFDGLLDWVNRTFPIGLTRESAAFESRSDEDNVDFLTKLVKERYDLKSSHEDQEALEGLERYIILNAVDRLWQEHLYNMDALREGVSLRAYGQKDPLVEYKNEAYAMFVELMDNIKGEVLNNLFRSTTNLQAFEQFLAGLPQELSRDGGAGLFGQGGPSQGEPAPQRSGRKLAHAGGGEEPEGPGLSLPIKRDIPKVGRNEPCPCGSGKKFKNCCGRLA